MPAACKAKSLMPVKARLEAGLIKMMIMTKTMMPMVTMMTMLTVSMTLTMTGAGSASQGMLGATRLAQHLLGTAPSALASDRQETTSKG